MRTRSLKLLAGVLEEIEFLTERMAACGGCEFSDSDGAGGYAGAGDGDELPDGA